MGWLRLGSPAVVPGEVIDVLTACGGIPLPPQGSGACFHQLNEVFDVSKRQGGR